MLEELRKKSFKSSLAATIFILIVAGVLTVVFGNSILYSAKGYDTFENLLPDEICDQMVEIDLKDNFGCFLEEYSQKHSYSAKKTTYLYYVIWTGDDYAEDYRYMAIKIKPSFETQLDDMCYYSYEGYSSDPIHLVGTIRKMGSDEYSYFKSFFRSAEWTDEDIAEGTLPYYIDVFGTSASSMKALYFAIAAGIAALFGWAIFRIVKGFRGGYLKKFTSDYENAGYTESTISSDYSRAQTYFNKCPLKFGTLCTYWVQSTVPRAIPNKNIVWAYQNTTTHRTNGIKTSTTYSVMIYLADGKTCHNIPVKNEALAQDILNKLNSTLPWVLIGYSDDLKKTYSKNLPEFLNYKYNKVDHNAVGDFYAQPAFEASKFDDI